MKIFSTLISLAAAALCAAAILPSQAAAACAPTWLTYGGSVAHTRSAGCVAQFNHGLTRKWTANEGGVLEFPPSYANGVLYTAQDSGRVKAQDAATGNVLWSRKYGSEWSVSPAVWIAGGLLFVEGRTTSHLHSSGLYALRIADGSIAWRASDWGGGEASPILVHTPAGTRLIEVNSAGQIASFDPRTGRSYWRRRIGITTGASVAAIAPVADDTSGCSPAPPSGGGGVPPILQDKYTGSPAYHAGVIYTANYSGDVWAITYRGRVRWHRVIPGSSIYSSPSYVHGNLFFTSRTGAIYSLRAADGSVRWRLSTGGMAYGSPAVAGGAVYASSNNGYFWKVSAATGRVLWHTYTGQSEMTSPVVVGRRVYFAHHGLCSGRHGSMVAYNVHTMRPVWRFNDGRYSPCLVAGNTLVIVGFGRLYGFR